MKLKIPMYARLNDKGGNDILLKKGTEIEHIDSYAYYKPNLYGKGLAVNTRYAMSTFYCLVDNKKYYFTIDNRVMWQILDTGDKRSNYDTRPLAI